MVDVLTRVYEHINEEIVRLEKKKRLSSEEKAELADFVAMRILTMQKLTILCRFQLFWSLN